MRSTEDLARDGAAVHELRNAAQQHRTQVDQLCKDYESLLNDYGVLKAQLEGARGTRGHYEDTVKGSSSTTECIAANRPSTSCTFFKRGFCKNGDRCHFRHPKSNAESSTSTGIRMDSIKWRASNDKGSNAWGKARSDKELDNDATTDDQIPDFSTLLPNPSDVPDSTIPVNKNSHRIDTYIRPSAPHTQAIFYARHKLHKLCNDHHLNGYCTKGPECEYDHTPAAPAIVACLTEIARTSPCPRGGGCRLLTCVLGHICRKGDCSKKGGKQHCKLGYVAHQQPLQVVGCVSGVEGLGYKGKERVQMSGDGDGGGDDDEGDGEDDGEDGLRDDHERSIAGGDDDNNDPDEGSEDYGYADSTIDEDLMDFEPITSTATKSREETFLTPWRITSSANKSSGKESLL